MSTCLFRVVDLGRGKSREDLLRKTMKDTNDCTNGALVDLRSVSLSMRRMGRGQALQDQS